MFIIGLWFLIISIYLIYLIVVLKPKKPASAVMWISILLSLGFGILILFQPFPEQKIMINLGGVLGLLTGLVQAWLAIFLLTAKK